MDCHSTLPVDSASLESPFSPRFSTADKKRQQVLCLYNPLPSCYQCANHTPEIGKGIQGKEGDRVGEVFTHPFKFLEIHPMACVSGRSPAKVDC
jgi:hypothetical protein